MRKLGWYALRVAVAAFVLSGLLLLAANLYVQSHGVQQRIRSALAGVLQMPVGLRKTTLTPWDGLRLEGVVLRPEEGKAAGGGPDDLSTDFLSAASFRVRFAWWPLISRGQVVVEQVLLDEPRLVWQQNADGRWSFPPGKGRPSTLEPEDLPLATPPAAGVPSGSPPTAAPILSETAAATPGATPPPVDAEPLMRGREFPLLIDRMRLRHGEITVRDRAGHPLVKIEDINLDGTITDPQHAACAAWFAMAATPLTGVTLTNYWTAVDVDEEAGVTLRDGHGAIGGGQLRTAFRLRTDEAGSPFTLHCDLRNVALGQVARVSPDQPPLAEGQLHGNLDCQGFADDLSSCTGGGRVWLVGAKVHEFPLMKIVGQLLRISDLSHLEFKQAEADYKVKGTVLRLESLVLAANDVRMVMQGQYLSEGDQLDLHGRLVIDQAVSHQLPQFIESNFTVCGNDLPGCRYLDFDVTGPISDPRCNLYDRMMAGPMKGLLDNLLAPKAKNPKNKLREENGGARFSPAASQTP